MKTTTRSILAAIMALVVALSIGAVAVGSVVIKAAEVPVPTCQKPSGNPSHAQQVTYAECLQKRTEALLNNLHPVPTVTETVEVPGPTVTETVTVSPDPEPTDPTTDPEPTDPPTTEPPSGTCVKPSVDNTGTSGTLADYTGSTYPADGAVIENKTVNGDLIITGDNVTVRNVRVTGKLGVMESVGARISNVSTPEFFISSAQDVVLEKSRISNSTTDSMHVTSDGSSMNRDVVIRNNLVHNPTPGQEEHYDGLQVRGVIGLDLLCNNFDLGPAQFPYNAAVYLEPANGGHSDVLVDNNWLMGGGHIFHYGAASVTPDDTRLTNNKFGGDPYWGPGAVCHNSPGVVPGVQEGNTIFGEPGVPCK